VGRERALAAVYFLNNKIAFPRISSKTHKTEVVHPQNMCGMLGAPWFFQATPPPKNSPEKKKKNKSRWAAFDQIKLPRGRSSLL
jgi:hypothetical protein